MNCYKQPQHRTSCAKNIALLRKYNKVMHLFRASDPLEFVAIDLLGEHIKIQRLKPLPASNIGPNVKIDTNNTDEDDNGGLSEPRVFNPLGIDLWPANLAVVGQ